MFAKNVGTFDRLIRIVIGVALLAFAVMGPADISWKWIGYIGIIPLLTAFLSTCPLYSILGLSSCPMRSN
ncbi:MAG: DUF2892 domain-containing protein [Hyphomicrobiales bacterium]